MTAVTVDAEEVLSSGQAAAIIGISLAQLARLRKNGTIPFVQTPGSYPRFRRSVVEAYATRYTHDPEEMAQ